jgi:flagellar protein FlaG
MEIKGASTTGLTFSTQGSEDTRSQMEIRRIPETTIVIKSHETRTNEIKEVDVRNAVDKLNKFLEDDKTHAIYEFHSTFNDLMIKIVDDKTGDVVLEIPPKKILDMIAKMCEMVGVMVDKKA